MSTPRKTRGEYRPLYEALFYGKDYRALSPEAKLCLVTLKGLGGVTGIKPWPVLAHSLAELTGIAVAKVTTALKQLVKAEWIEHEDGIVWVVRGLEFEPQMTPNNSDHRRHVQQSIAGLSNAPILARFRERYAEYMSEPEPRPSRRGASTPVPQAGGHPVPQGVGQGGGQAVEQGVPLPVPLHSPTPSPTTSPTLSTSPTPPPAGVVDPASGSHRQRLAAAANNGIKALLGYEHTQPIRWDRRSTHDAAELFARESVDIAFAERAVYELAKSRMPADGKPVESLRYFEHAVVNAWHAEQAHRLAATFAVPGDTPGAVVGTLTPHAPLTWDALFAEIDREASVANG